MRKIVIKSTNEVGWFHQWSIQSEEYGDGPAHSPVGIVEMIDGTVELVEPEYIQFVEPIGDK
jgi:hypothetical protein